MAKQFKQSIKEFNSKIGNEEVIIFDKKNFIKKLLLSVSLFCIGLLILYLKGTDAVYMFLDFGNGFDFSIYTLIYNFIIFFYSIFILIYGIVSSFKTIVYDNKGNKRIVNLLDNLF